LTLAALIRNAAREYPRQEAVIAADGRFTYAQIDAASDTVAKALAAAGITKGDHVGICAGNTGAWVSLFYGIAKAGAVSVPINTRLKPAEIHYQLRQAQVKLLFLADRLLNIDFLALFGEVASGFQNSFPQDDLPFLRQVVLLGEGVHRHCTSYRDFIRQGTETALPAEPAPLDPALIQYTSGTTSLPKGALLAHES